MPISEQQVWSNNVRWARPVAGVRGTEVPTIVTSGDDLVAISSHFYTISSRRLLQPRTYSHLVHHEQTRDLGSGTQQITSFEVNKHRLYD